LTQRFSPDVGESVDLRLYDSEFTNGLEKEQAQRALPALQERLRQLQSMLYAQRRYALLVVLQAMDTGGKDGTIKKVFDAVNPLGLHIANFKAPSAEELAHDFLWRIHQKTPPKGYIGIFNRSHYEDVLVVRVNELVPAQVVDQRYEQINDFERMLTQNDTVILKFYLHISKEEQKRRLQERLDDPTKRWKFADGDLHARERWDDYMQAYQDALTRCNTPYARWHIVPANKKWYRDYVVTERIVQTLETLDLRYPEPDLGRVVIPK
jgi:PPK2 family polyphosphate:nucleotide phosphotransferase